MDGMLGRGGWRLLIVALALAVGLGATRLAAEDAPTPAPGAEQGSVTQVEELNAAGKYAEAEALARKLLASAEQDRGPEALEVASIIDALFATLVARGKATQPDVRALAERGLAIRKKALAPDHPDVAQSLDNLATLLHAAGDYASARPLFEEALAIRREALGPDHALVADSLNNLARVLKAAGDYAAARPLYEDALATCKKARGPGHPTVASILNNLAVLLGITGDNAAAMQLHEEALAINKKALGPDHPAVANSLSNLAILRQAKGDYTSARRLFEEALEINKKALGPDHPDVATNLDNLAAYLHAEGDSAAARPLHEQALAIYRKVLGPDHPEVAYSLGNLASLLQATGDNAVARPLYEEALAIRRRSLGPDHPEVAKTLNNLAFLLQATGDYAAARPLHEEALAIHLKAFGPDHPDVAGSRNSLGVLLHETGDLASARPLLEEALATYKKALGPDHLDVALTLYNLSMLSRDAGDYASARSLAEQALAIQRKTLGPEHPTVGQGLNNLAVVLNAAGDFASARPLYEESLAIYRKVLGPDHPYVATSLNNLATLLASTGDSATARQLYEESLAIRTKALGPDHPYVAWSHYNLASVLCDTGFASDATVAALRAEEIGRRHLLTTSRSLTEREALGYASVRPPGINVILSLASEGRLDAPTRALAWEAALRSRGLVLDEIAGRHQTLAEASRLGRLGLALASAAQRLANLTVRGPGSEPPERYRALLDDARQDRDRAERALADQSVTFREDVARARLGVADVAGAVPSGAAVVAFCRYFHHACGQAPSPRTEMKPAAVAGRVVSYLAFVLREGEDSPAVVPLGTAETLDSLVSRWRDLAALPQVGAGAARSRLAGEELRRAAWDPVAARLGGVSRVFLVPDGALHLVNFSALPVDGGGYLVETGPLLHLLSVERDLVQSGGAASRGEGLLALGAPAFDERGLFAALAIPEMREARPVMEIAAVLPFRGAHASCSDFASLRFAPLPAAGHEVDEVAALWRSRSLRPGQASDATSHFLGSAASEAEFKARAPGRRVLHIATHGFFLGGACESALDEERAQAFASSTQARAKPAPLVGENPLLLSGLALAGANNRRLAGPDEEDGILTAEEIASLDLAGVEWAVLSACDTGLGDVKAGEGVFGLRRAFQVAGARTLVMSLWAVEDDATRAWMRALYEARLVKKLDTAECVREASLAVLRDRRARGDDDSPFWWGAFVASGDWK